ncbi:MAG: hypothetical protein KJ626_05880 [Verrucomicrobia bacterium]|nr:hypothetical protein [Verrucomicrobiota bacterium]
MSNPALRSAVLAVSRWTFPCLFLFAVSCSPPQSASEKEYAETIKKSREQRQQLREALGSGEMESQAIDLVKAAAAPDDIGTMEDWLVRQRSGTGEEILFPRWKAFRRGANKYEVQYTHSAMASDRTVTKRGYAWNVDVLLRIVGEPIELKDKELERRKPSMVPEQRRSIEKKRRYSLE